MLRLLLLVLMVFSFSRPAYSESERFDTGSRNQLEQLLDRIIADLEFRFDRKINIPTEISDTYLEQEDFDLDESIRLIHGVRTIADTGLIKLSRSGAAEFINPQNPPAEGYDFCAIRLRSNFVESARVAGNPRAVNLLAISSMLVHEFMHCIQFDIVTRYSLNGQHTVILPWIKEGTADAAAIKYVQELSDSGAVGLASGSHYRSWLEDDKPIANRDYDGSGVFLELAVIDEQIFWPNLLRLVDIGMRFGTKQTMRALVDMGGIGYATALASSTANVISRGIEWIPYVAGISGVGRADIELEAPTAPFPARPTELEPYSQSIFSVKVPRNRDLIISVFDGWGRIFYSGTAGPRKEVFGGEFDRIYCAGRGCECHTYSHSRIDQVPVGEKIYIAITTFDQKGVLAIRPANPISCAGKEKGVRTLDPPMWELFPAQTPFSMYNNTLLRMPFTPSPFSDGGQGVSPSIELNDLESMIEILKPPKEFN